MFAVASRASGASSSGRRTYHAVHVRFGSSVPMFPLVRAASLTHYCEVARTAGLNPLRMLTDAGLSSSVLQDPDLQVPVQRVGHLLVASADASGDESFGLRMAESRRISNLGPVGLLMRDQPTLRSSL